ncbi:hypothetical protein [Mesorhizobium sp. WSM3224]|uniref:hypothetical protein n=1 Tax=Mesorhizobium sp. WSM3224 TaxID=1040986 RepID=UPI0003F6A018|nr:hypothetical protein [Mesorhizobium sp. WSM3224]
MNTNGWHAAPLMSRQLPASSVSEAVAAPNGPSVIEAMSDLQARSSGQFGGKFDRSCGSVGLD